MFFRACVVIASLLVVQSNKFQTRKPQRFSVAPNLLLDVISAGAQFVFRLGSGAFVQGWSPAIQDDLSSTTGKKEYTIVSGLGRRIAENSDVSTFKARPAKFIELYEFEGCPFCRKVREAVTILDLDVLFYPCPKGGPTYRQIVKSVGGKEQFPYMIDPNTDVAIYESSDIISYLFDTYGNGEPVPASLSSSISNTVLISLSMLPRAGKGSRFYESKPAKEPLVFWGYEASPFCKIVRERLVELELAHIQRTCARGSPKRQELFDKEGLFQVPYLEDPNTGVTLFESSDILNYLNSEYAV